MTDGQTSDGLLEELERQVRNILRDDSSRKHERLKAIEVGVKLLMIRHKIDGAEGGNDGSFFTKSS